MIMIAEQSAGYAVNFDFVVWSTAFKFSELSPGYPIVTYSYLLVESRTQN